MKIGEAVAYDHQFWDDMGVMPPDVQDRVLNTAETSHYFQEVQATLGGLSVVGAELAGVFEARISDLNSYRLPEVTEAEAESSSEAMPVTESEPTKSPKQLAIEEWAIAAWRDYKTPISPSLSPKNRGIEERRRDRRLARHMSVAVEGEGGKRRHLMDDPDAPYMAISAWINVFAKNPSQDLVDEFRRKTAGNMADYIHEGWKELGPEYLKALVERHAKLVDGSFASESVHTQNVTENGTLSESFLKAYFEAPGTAEGRIDALYQFCQGVLMLDPASEKFMENLKAAADILNFDTKVITEGSKTHADVVLYPSSGMGNPEYLRKSLEINRVIFGLHNLIYDNSPRFSKSGEVARLLDSPAGKSEQNAIEQMSITSLGKDEYTKRFKAGYELLGKMTERQASEALSRRIGKEGIADLPYYDEHPWIGDALFNTPGPLGVLYDSTMGPLIDARGRFADLERNDAEVYAIEKLVQIPVGNGCVIDVAVPRISNENPVLMTLLQDEVVKGVCDFFRNEEILQGIYQEMGFERITQTGYTNVYPLYYFGLEVNGFENIDKIYGQIRPECAFDAAKMHSLARVAHKGFPSPPPPEGDPSVLKAVAETAADLMVNSERLVGRRKVRFPLNDPECQTLGYTHIDFQRIAKDNPSDIRVTIHIRQEKPIVYEMRDFWPTFNDRDPASLEKAFGAHYTVLSLLKVWAQEPVIDTDQGKIGEGYGKLARGGFFRYLKLKGDGKHSFRRNKQWFICVKEAGKDIDEESERRRPDDPRGEGRNSTWVRFTEADDPNMKPIVVYTDLSRIISHAA